MYANANLLLRKFSKCSVNVKCYLFKTYCSILYCAPMWLGCTKTALTKLKVAYNNSLRRFMGLPWHNSASEMFVNQNIKSFGELLRVFTHGFRSRIIISRNCILSSICNRSCSIYSKLWAWWQTLGYCMFICDRPHTYLYLSIYLRIFSKKFLKWLALIVVLF